MTDLDAPATQRDVELAQRATAAELRLALAALKLELVTWVGKWIVVTMFVAFTSLFVTLLPWLRR